ncbi:amidohydrolase family protein [Mycobacterium sp. Aquia_213]|uniref:amidohydrolase family protein n=1 Tax=Mycobacterium sp. Aquia_213 TaxID=2991728 RepID=UPI0022720017|nr:amidohydrolase family protein [Mycobacterium sp. Aquia_213]WAC90126.1 amidohydrolase family protein [Mycobacterium sp. Aquia_213]
MTSRPARIVDAHVHLWDPARTDWYPYLSAGQDQLNLGDVSGMSRRFDVPTYLAESAGWNVEKLVNVAAATGRHSIDETLELDRRADTAGHPDAIIGGLPPAETVAQAVAAVDEQLAAPRLRGVRPMGVSEASLPPGDVLCALQERGLLYEVMTHPDQLVATAKGLEQHGDLVVVVEHAGWPRNGSDEERALWAEGIDALAGLGDNVLCKLSGLAMPLGSMSVDVQRPWLEHVIDAFGVDRCFFASNFPVDGMHGTFDELYTSYSAITSSLGDDARDKLFAANAERVYRC